MHHLKIEKILKA